MKASEGTNGQMLFFFLYLSERGLCAERTPRRPCRANSACIIASLKRKKKKKTGGKGEREKNTLLLATTSVLLSFFLHIQKLFSTA
jgi:hypothetical protein